MSLMQLTKSLCGDQMERLMIMHRNNGILHKRFAVCYYFFKIKFKEIDHLCYFHSFQYFPLFYRAGLVGEYYATRWNLFFDALIDAVNEGERFNQVLFHAILFPFFSL